MPSQERSGFFLLGTLLLNLRRLLQELVGIPREHGQNLTGRQSKSKGQRNFPAYTSATALRAKTRGILVEAVATTSHLRALVTSCPSSTDLLPFQTWSRFIGIP